MKKISELTEVKHAHPSAKNVQDELDGKETSFIVARPVKTVSGWARFGHFLIDYICIIGVQVAINYLLTYQMISGGGVYSGLNTAILCFNSLWYSMYYFVLESSLQRTLGKMVTNSVVINEYAQKPSVGQLLGRSVSRLVPFEIFSCLGPRGWHDTWTNTYVVTIQERDELLLLLESEGDVTEDSLIIPEDL